MHKKHILILILASSFFFAPLFSFAQVAGSDPTITADMKNLIDGMIKDSIPTDQNIQSNAISNLLETRIIPPNPGPNEMVSISIESYVADLNKASITWSVDGVRTSQGIGKTQFSFKNAGSGEQKRVGVAIITNTGEQVKKEFMFNPVGVTILWEANTYTPPFYKGKPLMSPQAWVRVTAIPDVTGSADAIDPQNLVYTWKKNGTTLPEVSGYGKNSYAFFGPKPGRDLNLRVAVSSVNDSIQSEIAVNIPQTNPFILFYEKHPLLGEWSSRPLDSRVTLAKNDFTVVAEPYFFSNETQGSRSLSYEWSLNGRSIENPGRSATLRNDTKTKGTSELSLTMRNTKLLFQIAGQSLTVDFSPEESRPQF